MRNFMRKIKRAGLLFFIFMMVVCAQPVPAKAASTESMTVYGLYLDTSSKGDSVLIKSAGRGRKQKGRFLLRRKIHRGSKGRHNTLF